MKIHDLIIAAGHHLRSEFEQIKATNPHFGERGTETEVILQDFLNEHLPKRYAAGSGFVIDDNSQISKQQDVIVYDAINSPLYRTGERCLILPCDNVASVIEVKSKLNKAELEDAAEKISSVKSLQKSPLSNVDQPVTFSELITTQTYGIVFAYDTDTSLESLAGNLKEINERTISSQWIDLVVVLDKGIIGYSVQYPFADEFAGTFIGRPSPMGDSPIPPFYIHLIVRDLGELTLNKFIVNLMAHLTFYRKKSTIDTGSLMGDQPFKSLTIQGYQFNLSGELVPGEETHRDGKLIPSMLKYNLYNTTNGSLVGQISWVPWQDGASISCSCKLGPPHMICQPYFDAIKKDGLFIPLIKGQNLWFSSIVPLTKEKFVEISENIKGDLVARPYIEVEKMDDFPMTLDAYDKLPQKQNGKL